MDKQQAAPTPAEALKAAHEAIKWMMDNMRVEDSGLQSDAFNIPANALHVIEMVQEGRQSPTDALNINEIENLLREFYTKNKDGKGGGYALRLLKSITTAAPQAGPVWVKVTDRLPGDSKFKSVRDARGRFYEGYATAGLFKIIGIFCSPKDYNLYEWLDESGQQVFTREQVIEIAKEAMFQVKNGDWNNFSALTEYMNTYYPNL